MNNDIEDLEAAVLLLSQALPLADASASHLTSAHILQAIDAARSRLRYLKRNG